MNDLVWRKAEAAHARLYLDMDHVRLLPRSGVLRQLQGHVKVIDGRCQSMREQVRNLVGKHGSQDQNRAANAGLAQRNAFLDGRDTEARDAQLRQCPGNHDSSMPVGISFHHGEDLACVREEAPHLREVMRERGQINGRNSRGGAG